MAVGVLTSIKVDPVAGKFTAIYTADATKAASGVYCGFKPRIVRMTQVAGTPDATAQSLWYDAGTAAYNVLIGNTGAFTIATSNGITFTDGSEASPVAAATNSPNSSGPGFVIGTGVQANSLVYLVEATH